MGEWYIYGSNGSVKATIKKLEYSGEFMGETSVTCDAYSPSPISFSVGDYLVYRGERFTIDYDATRLKQSSNNTYGRGYTYENMRFLSYVGELKKCEFLDFVPSDNLIPFSQSPQFSFFAEDVSDLADRLQANLDRIYTGNKAWTVQVVSGFEGKTNIEVSVSNINIFDGLKIAYDQFEATYIIRGRTITIGTAGNELETDFKYGKGNGLKTIERSVSESDTLVTRLRAYGNTTNMPPNYYKNLGMQVYLPIREVAHVSQTGCDIHFNKITTKCFLDPTSGERTNFWVSVSLDKSLWLKAVVSPNQSNSSVDFSVVSVMLYDGNTQAMLTQFLSQLQSGSYDDLYFSGAINHGAWPIEYREYEEDMPDLMSIDRLMLPGFPSLTTDPYIDASNIGTLGIREKSVFFDGSDPDTPDIHPTLEGMTAAELRAAGYTIDLDAGDNGNLDEIAADATELDGSPITADGSFGDVDEVPGFKVTIKDIGFNIKDYLSQDTATLVIKSGMCGAREFTIVDVQKVGNKYVLECQRTEDSSINKYYPYNPYLIKAGDKFVLINLEMPDAYVAAASQRLLTAAQAYIAKYSAPQYVYAIKMDDIWMQKQRDNSVSEASSYYWNIKEGDVMNVQDTDLGIDISEVIDRLNIREGFGPVPEFEVVLRKEKPQGTIGVLQNRIRQLELRNAEQVSTIYRQQNYIDLIIGDKLNTIQEQLDHVQVTYFGDYVPTLSNEPASTWQSSEYSEHDGDMFYNRESGKGYEFTYQNGSWGWIEIQDEDIRQALEEAAAAQDTADGKRRVFVTPAGTLPTPPYDENDLWMNATFPSNSTSTDESQHEYYNDILKCITPRAEGATASINDWSLGSKYTDDSSLNAFVSGTYQPFVTNIQNQVDKKAETWRQPTDPSNAQGWVASEHVGDIWMDTSANGGKKTYIYQNTGTSSNPNYQWVAQDVPDAVFDEIDGKAEIFVQKPTTYSERDMWIIEENLAASDLPAGCKVKDIVVASNMPSGTTKRTNNYVKGDWQKRDRYSDDTVVNTIISQYGNIMGITTPTAANVGEALGYLRQVLQGTVTTDGGLILANMLALKSGNTVMSGINGQINSSLTNPLKSIAAWFGGSMKDKEVYTTASDAAKSLFRFDGSGYVADGNITWDENGQVTIQGYQIKVGGSNVATESSISTFFANFFDIYNGSTQITYEQYVALQDKSNVSIKAKYGLWTEQFLSALGLNSQGGGGTGEVSAIRVSSTTLLQPTDGVIDMTNYVSTATQRSHWDAVYAKVPAATYNTGNELADKNFVNSSISTATAEYQGSKNLVSDLSLTTSATRTQIGTALGTAISGADNNDYCFVEIPTSDSDPTQIARVERYKYNGTSWSYEYTLNNSGFTSNQWSAINSGITSTHVTKLNGIAAGAQVNVLESVKINGTALSISSKAVNILTGNGLQSSTNTISIKLDTNSGLLTSSSGLKLDIVNDLVTNNAYKALSAAQGKSLNDRLAVLESWFEVDANGDIKTKNTAGGHVRGFYTESFVSALGSNSSGGGGGGDVSSVMFDTSISYHTGTPVYTATDGVIHLPPYPTSVTWANVSGKPSWIGSSKPTYSLSEISGTDDLQAIEGLTGTSGLLKKTAANTWALDTNTYATQTWVSNNFNNYTLPLAASGTRGGVQIGYSESNSGSSTTRNYAVKLSSEKMYVNVPWTDTTYKLTLNNTTNGASGGTSLGSFYAPTASGTANQVLISGGANTAPSWTAQSNLSVGSATNATNATTASKLSTVSKKAWGQTYWTSGGVPQDVDGTLTISGGELQIWNTADTSAENRWDMRFACSGEVFQMWAYEGAYHDLAIGNTAAATATYKGLYYDASEKMWGIGTTTPAYTFDVQGNIGATGSLSLVGTSASTRRIYFGDTSHYIELTSTGFHFTHGIYSDSFVSALGANSSGGGGGGGTVTGIKLASNTSAIQPDANGIITIPAATTSAFGVVKVGSTLSVSSGTINLKASGVTAGTYPKVTVDTYGRVTSGASLAASDIPDLSGVYYALYGGTSINSYGTSSSHYDLNSLTTVGSYYCSTNAASAYFDNMPTTTDHAFRIWVSAPVGTGTTYIRQRFQFYDYVGAYERVSTNSGSSWGDWYTVQSNLANYALASSLDSYLPLSGGTMTGSITFPNAAAANNSAGVKWAGGSMIGESTAGGLGIYSSTDKIYIRPNVDNDGYTNGVVVASDSVSIYRTFTTTSADDVEYAPARLYFITKDTRTGFSYTAARIAAYHTQTATATNGVNMVITPGGNLFVGGGESAASLYALYKGSTTEHLYLTGDSQIYVEAAANTIADRRGFIVTSGGHVVPCRAEETSDNTANLGASGTRWANVYATTFHGALDGNATTSSSCSGNAATATKATQDGSGNVITSTYLTAIGRSGDYLTQTKGGTASNVTKIFERNGTYTHAIKDIGWYRIGRFLTTGSASASCILLLSRSYAYKGNESYAFSITLSYSGKISISQLAGYYHSNQLIDKIRVEYVTDNSSFYVPIDIHVNEDTTGANTYRVTFIGGAQALSEYEKDPTLTGSTFEYNVFTGMGTATRSTDNTAVQVTNSNGSVRLATATNRGVYDTTNSAWLVGTNGTNTFLMDGNVGIGNTDPAYALDVNGSTYSYGYIYLGRNNYGLYTKDSGGSVRNTINLNSANELLIGYGTAGAGYNTYLYGNSVTLKYGTSRTTGITLSSSGATTFAGNVSVGGTLDVTGASTLTGNITAGGDIYLSNAKYIRANNSSGTAEQLMGMNASNQLLIGYGHRTSGSTILYGLSVTLSTNGTSRLYVLSSGNVGIANSSPSEKLHVTGNILASGEVTASSDERKKNIISNTKFNVKDIASARSIIYEWNDDRDKDNEKKIHGGSIAQDWLGKADSFLSQDNDGWYSINYGALALCSAITIARMTINHEDRITLLEKENAKLKARVAELEERRA